MTMRAIRRTCQRFPRLRSESGYTLVEMMAAIGISLVVGLGVFAVFNSSQKAALKQRSYNDVQTSCGFALDQVKRDLTLAGYRAKDPDHPISSASANSITFEFYDDNAISEGSYDANYERNTQITYSLAGSDLNRAFKRWYTPSAAANKYQTTTTQTLAQHVSDLTFSYFSNGGVQWTSGDTADIRTVRVSLTCEASKPDPATGKTAQLTVVAEVRPRNVDIKSNPLDAAPPDSPAPLVAGQPSLVAWDPGTCGTLQLRWPASTESDLEGYILYYGLATGEYSKRVTIARPHQAAGSYEEYLLTGLTTNLRSNNATPTRYYFAIAAFDKSGNQSGRSPEAASAVGKTTNTRTLATVASLGTDTVIDIDPPPAPTGLTVTAVLDGQLTLRWTAPSVAGLAGYRVYRGTTSTFLPSAANRIGDESMPELGPAKVEFVDTGADMPAGKLTPCTEGVPITYYYKVATITCDSSIPLTDQYFAAASGVALDRVKPLAPGIIARPGYKRIILNVNNPVLTGPLAVPDFRYTKIWYSTVTHPSINTGTGAVSGGSLIPDRVPYPGTDGLGVFTQTGTVWPPINFNSLTDGNPAFTNPMLPSGTVSSPMTYYFLAVAYDQCNNFNEFSALAISEGTQCGDCDSTEVACYNAPPAPGHLNASGCFDNLSLAWDTLDTNVVRDLAGYHIWRCVGNTCAKGDSTEVELTAGTPSWPTTITDTTIVNGLKYSYRIEAADCYYERYLSGDLSSAEQLANPGQDNVSSSTINSLSVGPITLETTLPEKVTGYLIGSTAAKPFVDMPAEEFTNTPPTFLHNTVTFWLKNANANFTTLNEITASWDTAAAYLKTFTLGDGNTTLTPATPPFKDTAPTLIHSAAGSTLTLTNARLAAGDDKIPLAYLFKTQGNGLDRTVDVRGDRLLLSFKYLNEGTNDNTCTQAGTFNIPLGPSVRDVTQDLPSFGQTAWAVPGDFGANIPDEVVVPGQTNVTVYAEIEENSAPVSTGQVRLYYYYDISRALTAAPAPTGAFPDGMGYTRVFMTKVAGNQWRGSIPFRDNADIWYFIVAVDAQGNFDREPEPWAGAFQYFQEPSVDCATIPKSPTLTGVSTTSNVKLDWTGPNENTTGAPYTDRGGYEIWKQAGTTGTWTLLTSLGPTTLTYTDSTVATDIQTVAYSYQVKAYDTCATANTSAASTTYTDTIEDPCSTRPSAPTLFATTNATSVDLTWTRPDTNITPAGSAYIDEKGYHVYRSTNGGAYAMLNPPHTITVPDTLAFSDPHSLFDLTNNSYSYQVTAYDTCLRESDRSNTVEEEQLLPCDTKPGQPPTLAGTVLVSGTTVSVKLDWTAPTTNLDPLGIYYGDPGGYNVYRLRDGVGPTKLNSTILPPSTLTFTDTSVFADVGTAVYEYYVTALDTCTPTRNESPASPHYAEGWNPCGHYPAAPTLTPACTSNATTVTLAWTLPTTTTPDGGTYETAEQGGIRIYRKLSTDLAFPALPLTADGVVGPTATSYTDSSLTQANLRANSYQYALKAYNKCMPTAKESQLFSNIYTDGTTACIPTPAAPAAAVLSSSVVPAADTTKTVTLTWTQPAGTTTFEVWRCKAPGSNTTCSPATDTAAPGRTLVKATSVMTPLLSYTDTVPDRLAMLTGSTKWRYFYQVRAFNNSCLPTTYSDSNSKNPR